MKAIFGVIGVGMVLLPFVILAAQTIISDLKGGNKEVLTFILGCLWCVMAGIFVIVGAP